MGKVTSVVKSKDVNKMIMPGYTAETSLYRTATYYRTSVTAGSAGGGIQPAQLPTCGVGGICLKPESGFTCNCPAGQQCAPAPCPLRCYTQCFLFWCWTRCVRPEVCPV